MAYVQTPLNQLSKLPKLFSHYQEHHQSNETCSFLDFMIEHYVQTNKHDDDAAQDRQLPFKNFDTIVPAIVAIVPCATVQLPALIEGTPLDFLLRDCTPRELKWASNFFQPPCC